MIEPLSRHVLTALSLTYIEVLLLQYSVPLVILPIFHCDDKQFWAS